jgi:hypothetical protein
MSETRGLRSPYGRNRGLGRAGSMGWPEYRYLLPEFPSGSPTGASSSARSPGLPQIRTCGFPASGSSEHGFATSRCRSGAHARPRHGKYPQQPSHAFPRHPACGGASAQGPAPEAFDPVPQLRERSRVANDAVVAVVAAQLLSDGPVLLTDRVVHVLPQPLTEVAEKPREPSLRRLLFHHPPSLATASPVPGESQQHSVQAESRTSSRETPARRQLPAP